MVQQEVTHVVGEKKGEEEEANIKETWVHRDQLLILVGGGGGFREGSRCFQGGKGVGSVVTDRVKSGTVENWLPKSIYYQRGGGGNNKNISRSYEEIW